jgi:hypothetical protein
MEAAGETVLPKGLALAGLFSRNGYRAMMGLKRLPPEEYFRNQGPDEILNRRGHLLATSPQDFVCEPPIAKDCAAVIEFGIELPAWSEYRTIFC